MRRYHLIALALLFVLMPSCKEKEEQGEDTPSKKGDITLVSILSPLGSIQPVWSSGDKISVLTEDGSAVFSLSEGALSAEGKFSGEFEGLKKGDDIFCCHPAMENLSMTAVPVELASQRNLPGVTAPADISVVSGEYGQDLVFEHILGGVSITLNNKSIVSQPVNSLGIISNEIILSGSYNALTGEMTAAAPVKGKTVFSVAGESVGAKSNSSWVLSMMPQTLPEGSKAFLELTPGDTLFKALSRTMIKKDKLLEFAFEIEFEGIDINATIDPFTEVSDKEKTIAPVWQNSAALGVFSGNNSINWPFSLVSGSGNSQALFHGNPEVNDGDPFVAYYPYTEEITDDGTIEVDYNSDLAVAKGSVGANSEAVFHHVMGAVAVQVTNTSDRHSLYVNTVGVSGEGLAFAGTCNVLSGELTPAANGPAEAVITTNRSVQPGYTDTFLIYLLPQEIAAGTKVFFTNASEEVISVNIPSSVSVAAGEYLSVALEAEGERGGGLTDMGVCAYDTEGTVIWTSPALSMDGQTAYVTSSNYKIAAVQLSGDRLSEAPAWVCDVKGDAGMEAGGGNVTSTPAVSSNGIYALLGKGVHASLVRVNSGGTLDYYRWASYYVNGNYTNPDPSATEFEFDMQTPIIFPTTDVYKGRVMFQMQSNQDLKRFVSARENSNPDGDDDQKTGGSRQTSKGTTTNLGGTIGYVRSDGWIFIAGRTGSNPGGMVVKTNKTGGSMSGSTSGSQMLGYIDGSIANGRGSQMSQDDNYVYYMGWNPLTSTYPGGSTLLFRYSKNKIEPSSSIAYDWVVALPGGVSTSSSSGMRGVGSVLSADGSVIYVTTCKAGDESAYVHAVNTSDGSIKWSHEAGDLYGVAAVDDLGYVYYNDRDLGKLFQLDPLNGEVTDSVDLNFVASSPTIGPGGIIWCNTRDENNHPALRTIKISDANGPARGWSQLGGNPQKSGTAY